MDTETIAALAGLGLDALAFLVAYFGYKDCERTTKALETAQKYPLDASLGDKIRAKEDGYEPYGVIQGKVGSLTSPLKSKNGTPGVIYRNILSEDRISRDRAGFWFSNTREIKREVKEIPWALESTPGYFAGPTRVHVIRPAETAEIELTKLSQEYHKKEHGVQSSLFEWFRGEHVKGLRETEEMLVKGIPLTGIGELVVAPDSSVHLQMPRNGLPFILTPLPISRIVEQYKESQHTHRIACWIFGAVGVYFCYVLVRKYGRAFVSWLQEQKEEVEFERIRRDRTQQSELGASSDETDSSASRHCCVVCLSNPREIILLPCGHVCLCVDCFPALHERKCPVCREDVTRVERAYVP